MIGVDGVGGICVVIIGVVLISIVVAIVVIAVDSLS